MSDLTIPKTQRAVVITEINGPLLHQNDRPVVQQSELKPGQGQSPSS